MPFTDASRFLAQSHSRLPSSQNDNVSPSRNPSSRQQSNSRLGGRTFLPRPNNMPGPYQQPGSQLSRFPFTSRAPVNPAPLFYSATDEFRDQDDGAEHQRDAADLYALQKSRRGFGPSHLTESSDGDEIDRSEKEDETEESQENDEPRPFGRRPGRGIRSSWRGEREEQRGRTLISPKIASVTEERDWSAPESIPDSKSRKGKNRLVDVELSSSENSSIDKLNQDDLKSDVDAPGFDGFAFTPSKVVESGQHERDWQSNVTDDEASQVYPRTQSPEGGSVLPGIAEEEESEVISIERHDYMWAQLFVIANGALLASALLVYLHTDEPSSGTPLGDTIYTILRKSYLLLAIDTIVAIIVAAVWLVLLRNFLRPLTYLIVYSVPVILFAFTLWPFITSFNGNWGGKSAQDKVMRIFSSIPFIGAVVWTYMAIQSRHSINRAIDIVELASTVLSASPALFIAGFASLVATVAWFWIWLLMFTRVFLEGHWASNAKKLFVIDTGTWWLGIFFILMLLWTQMTISGLQRATTAAAVSQWYFYRQAQMTNTSRDIVLASFNHATGPLLGTVCLSQLISLLIRLPLLILPSRFAGFCTMCVYTLIPAPLVSLTDPLTLTYAAIHSQPLAVAARGFSRLPLSSNTQGVRPFRGQKDTDSLSAYRTTHILLHATRQIMALALGLGAWLSTARLVHLSGASYAGSAYAYIIGLGAAVVGWGVLGAVEGIIGGVVDACLVCWGSEIAAASGQGRGRVFCKEAEAVFGNRWEEESRERRIMV
jgi:Plasma-membrane choline transporter